MCAVRCTFCMSCIDCILYVGKHGYNEIILTACG